MHVFVTFVISDFRDVALVLQNHVSTPARVRNARTVSTAPLSVPGEGCGR
jgi:hypothetical protein